MVLQRVVKPKTQKGKRFLEGREPKVAENTKISIFVKGGNTSMTVTQVMKELYLLKKPNAVSYKRKNILRPFEDETPLEFFAKKSDAALFAFGCHSKKRPDNLILGRMFDFHVLDMFELGVENFKSMHEMQGSKSNMGSKPCLLFAGEAFDQDAEHKRLKNLFIDFFRGPVVSQVRIAGLEHIIQITALDGKILLRNYKIMMKKSGSKTPRVELEDMGPSLDFVIRRTKLASDDLYKRSLRKPKTAKPRKTKNVSHNPFGSKLGRIHMDKQDLGKLQTRKMKGLKKSKKPKSKDGVSQPKVVKETNGPSRAKRAKKSAE